MSLNFRNRGAAKSLRSPSEANRYKWTHSDTTARNATDLSPSSSLCDDLVRGEHRNPFDHGGAFNPSDPPGGCGDNCVSRVHGVRRFSNPDLAPPPQRVSSPRAHI